MAKKLNKLPGVLSFQRCLLVTDGLFYNELGNGNLSPLWVMRHGIRGTQNINKASKEGQAASASAKREEVSNIQTTDSAKLDANASALQVRFNLRGMDIKKALFACAPGQKDSIDDLNAFKADLAAFVDRAKESEALVHLACRYVRNIANGRFLWRNRTVASSATVEVLLPDGTKKMFDALATPFNHFEEVSDDERAVAEVLARGWKGDPATELLKSSLRKTTLRTRHAGLPAPCIAWEARRTDRISTAYASWDRRPCVTRRSAMPCEPSIHGIRPMRSAVCRCPWSPTAQASMHRNSSATRAMHPASS